MPAHNEIGRAAKPPRSRVKARAVERALGRSLRRRVKLPPNAAVETGPSSCPACGADQIMWGCDPEQRRVKAEIHPLVWDEEAWMADSFICRSCLAGWHQPDDSDTVTWVRPYWVD